MRVSEQQRYMTTNRRIGQAREDNMTTMNQLASQKRINKVHDDPVEWVRALKIKNRLAEMEDYSSNIEFAKGFLSVTESALAGVIDRVSRAQELAVAMANGTYDKGNRQSTSKEVKEIVNEITQLVNSKYGAKFVFSGFRSTYPAVDSYGNFLGDDGQIFLQMGPEFFKRVNLPGREILEASVDERERGHFNLIDSIELLVQGLENDEDHSIYKAMEELSFQMDKLINHQAAIGSATRAVEESGKIIEGDELQKTEVLSKIEGADIFKLSSDFKQAETVLQSTLLASNKLLQPSLLNFLQ